jgi:hypothetical protein
MNGTEQTTQPPPGGCFCCGAGPALSEFLHHLGPSGAARTHFDQARVEFLKGLRALIDARIDELSARHPAKGAAVPVE